MCAFTVYKDDICASFDWVSINMCFLIYIEMMRAMFTMCAYILMFVAL